MVSATSGLAVLAVLAIAALAVGTSVVASAMPGDISGSGAPSDGHRCEVANAIHDILGHREPGTTVGSVISDMAQNCRPEIRH